MSNVRGALETNRWTGAGSITQDVLIGRLTNGQECCSFQLATQAPKGRRAWVRVNVYEPGLVAIAKELGPGRTVQITGELMNRKRSGRDVQFTEVRAFDIDVLT